MFDQITLSNGLRLIGERLDHVRSVSVGLWLGAGSQYEIPPEAGVSHFLEHMAFKGTQKRTARQIAEEMDAVGGQLNAFTSKECTCFPGTRASAMRATRRPTPCAPRAFRGRRTWSR